MGSSLSVGGTLQAGVFRDISDLLVGKASL